MNWFVQTLNKLGIDVPKVYVETGLFRGDGLQAALGHFDEIHGIELDPIYHNICRERFLDTPNVYIHLGDSGECLKYLSIEEPALFFLDAHWSGGETAFGRPEDNGCPVLRELESIGHRIYHDVIIVDDMRLMGTVAWSGEDGTDWPKTKFDFSHVSLPKMINALGWDNLHAQMADDIDRLILWRG